MRYIYVIRNVVNGKVYVGQTKDPKGRKAGHWYAGTHNAKGHLYDAMRKYGIKNFTFDLLEECEIDVVDDRERHWIAYFSSLDCAKGYNKESGGHANKSLSEETKRKISERLTGVPHTPERTERTAAKLRGRPNPKSRKEHNPEKGRKISLSLTGRSLSVEHKRATSEGLKRYMAQRGEWHPSAEALVKMSAAQKEVGKRRTAAATVDASCADAQPKECPVCHCIYEPKKLTVSHVKRHAKKRWCSRRCGRIGQNAFLSQETRLKISASRRRQRHADAPTSQSERSLSAEVE